MEVTVPIPSNKTTQAALGQVITVANVTSLNASADSVHVVALDKPLSSNAHPVVLPLNAPYPSYLYVDHNATLVSVDVASLQISSKRQVIYVANTTCDSTVCALPLDVEDRAIQSKPNHWGFLLSYDETRDAYRLLGVGSDPVTDSDGIWGFSWLPQVLTSSSFTSINVHGVATVLSVNKEIVGGKQVETTSVYTGYIAGLRKTPDGNSFCAGSLITPRLVLTAAGCNFTTPIWVAIDTLNTNGEAAEAIRVKRIIIHPDYKQGGMGSNFMILQLGAASSRKPIRLVGLNNNKFEGTAFGYGATKLKSKTMNHRLRNAKVQLYTSNSCPESVRPRLDSTTFCTFKSICWGDFGGPLTNDAWSGKRQLIGVIGTQISCQWVLDHTIVGNVSSVLEWIIRVITGLGRQEV
ncbi:hypothetical protein Poli38472_011485 [Pythium oligandrum]|uniref:Peptidase S1 domain-containing protein n=1 Tax=Pythium oligandrum TaxID=41045 RepID=A0A8K1FI48_PYTOL|nr:hypothetical protein Poli38472_011485 [Pythium oligandrum]|eukprot:TMW64605.1 hypothetical protein Poli38472_011485 [Pythium oligandrum]